MPTGKELLKQIQDRVVSGEYLLGDLVEGKTFAKLVLVDGEIKREFFTVEARHIPLEEIRSRIYKEHSELGMFLS